MEPLWRDHSHRRLVEPFAGGLAVALGLRPRAALLCDRNAHVIAFYRWLQAGFDPSAVDVRLENDRAVFARNRDRFNELIATAQSETLEAAVLFYYLNRTGFNGLCRFNASGYFNVPFGRYKRIEYRDAAYFTRYKDALTRYEFACADFSSLSLEPDDFVYADPPYDVEFTSYSAGGFPWTEQVRLAHWLAAHSGPVVASNQATDRVLELYRGLGFTVRTLPAPRRISCNGNRDSASEMIALRNL